jgi:hypothetical protein
VQEPFQSRMSTYLVFGCFNEIARVGCSTELDGTSSMFLFACMDRYIILFGATQ